ncbi:hypothetical protein KAJ89_03790 [Candidatus Parcubacteria bacterium]|nr:hypothetical protein [Candidatus Parcubacteria bacterium]
MTKEQKFDENGNRVICAKCDNPIRPGQMVCDECSERVNVGYMKENYDPEEKPITNLRC